jgi:branched-chain amino acid transport system permease protein
LPTWSIKRGINVALSKIRGKFKLDLFRSLPSVPGLDDHVDQTLALVNLIERPNTPVSELAYGEKPGSKSGWRLRPSQASCFCSTNLS